MSQDQFGWGAGPWGRGTWGQLDIEIVIPTRPTIDVFIKGGGGGRDAGEAGDVFQYDEPERIERTQPAILVPDAIAGPGRWKPFVPEPEAPAERIRPIVYNFASDIPPDSRHRIMVFLMAGIHIQGTVI
jgi:hypothetical protein